MEDKVEYKRIIPDAQTKIEIAPSQEKKITTHKGFDESLIQKLQQHIDKLSQEGLVIPPDYNVSNALIQAKLQLLDLRDDKGVLVIEQCTTSSVFNALLKMVLSGFNVAKKHCAFVKYGNQLVCQPEYFGNLMLAKRDAGVKEVNGHCVYQGDEFVYEVDTITGRKRLIKHIPSLENQDIKKIKGAYAIVTYNDGTSKMEVMTIDQIRESWGMGRADGKSKAHTNFTDQQCIKTVMNRAVKIDINSSDDSEVLGAIRDDDDNKTALAEQARTQIIAEGKKKEIDAETVTFEVPEKQDEKSDKDPY